MDLILVLLSKLNITFCSSFFLLITALMISNRKTKWFGKFPMRQHNGNRNGVCASRKLNREIEKYKRNKIVWAKKMLSAINFERKLWNESNLYIKFRWIHHTFFLPFVFVSQSYLPRWWWRHSKSQDKQKCNEIYFAIFKFKSVFVSIEWVSSSTLRLYWFSSRAERKTLRWLIVTWKSDKRHWKTVKVGCIPHIRWCFQMRFYRDSLRFHPHRSPK